MADESGKGSRPRRSGKNDVSADGTPRRPFHLPNIELDDTLEFDFYDKPISGPVNNSPTEPNENSIPEFDERLLPLTDRPDASADKNPSQISNEKLDFVKQSGLKTPKAEATPLSETDAIVQWLRHGEEVELEHSPRNPATPSTDSANRQATHPIKRLLARTFDLTWILLVLQIALVTILNLAHSTAFHLMTQYLPIQLLLSLILIPLALILEAGILADFGNSPGKFFFGLKVARAGQEKIKFRHYFARACLVWFKGLACGIPVLSPFTVLRQYFHLSKHGITSYDKSLGMQVIAVKTSLARKTSLLLSALLLAGILVYLLPIKVNPASAVDAWDSLQMNIKRIIGYIQ